MKKREKILATIFLFTFLTLGGGIGFDLYSRKKEALIEKKWALELKLAEYETLLEEAGLWETRENWLDSSQPRYTTRDTIDNYVFKMVKNPPSGVTVSKLKLIEGSKSDHWVQAGVGLLAQGTLKEVFAWLYELQSPDNFFVIENLKVTPEKKTLDVIQCEFELVRWYRPQS